MLQPSTLDKMAAAKAKIAEALALVTDVAEELAGTGKDGFAATSGQLLSMASSELERIEKAGNFSFWFTSEMKPETREALNRLFRN